MEMEMEREMERIRWLHCLVVWEGEFQEEGGVLAASSISAWK